MKAFVITIEGHEDSERVASRCISSGKRFDLDIQTWKATTPADNVVALAEERNLPLGNFIERYSRSNNCVAAFLSHYSLWEECIRLNEPVVILEHDAIMHGPVAQSVSAQYGPVCTNLGQPSYGAYRTPDTLGINRLTSKAYFPGAHAYLVNPEGARLLISLAKVHACPTDLYLNLKVFDWLTEYYPWVAEARDTFSTIQNFVGCKAKHGYNSDYTLSDV